ncbi:class I SAM-dependent methyltransferase [Mesorhizobium sp. ZC-5]|uniref:class I SAM-dependent methyltransferase n=1 Tax=Mesorhizobium sp. ZC-5 TaxID=2986066 RepID=UPI0021E8AA23|nr:class I SAM-dependent methyltransferase [Mesorhizobium sp. ZC-5]MCV3243674.1 class I SAM-dependent methyltransferase [Mesorhizobium sp. ZC-5]
MKSEARLEAQKQWNATACGELEGDKETPDYFLAVEKDRFAQQAWALEYFDYSRFAGKRVLEIGIGQGTDLMQFAKAGAECFGVDITDNHLELTARNFRLRGKKVDLRKADATQLPFPDGYFDCVYSFGVMHHIPEIDRVVAEVHRVLKPDGVIMVALYYKWSAFHLIKWLLLKGLLKGDMFKLGYSGLLATIETGADGKVVKPYVKLYGKAETRRLLQNFEVDDVSVHQLFAEHILPSSAVGRLRNKELPLSSVFGWYVACKARKAASSGANSISTRTVNIDE